MRHQVLLCIIGAKSRKQPGYHTAHCQKRQVGKDAGSAGQGVSNQDLSDIVEQGAENAGDENKTCGQKAVYRIHCRKAKNAAAEAVEQGYHLSGKYRGQQDAGHKHPEGVCGGEIHQQEQCHNIGEPQLDARNGNRVGDGAFRHKNSECNYRKNRQGG